MLKKLLIGMVLSASGMASADVCNDVASSKWNAYYQIASEVDYSLGSKKFHTLKLDLYNYSGSYKVKWQRGRISIDNYRVDDFNSNICVVNATWRLGTFTGDVQWNVSRSSIEGLWHGNQQSANLPQQPWQSDRRL
jgi:hypothetical protein